MDVDVDIGIGEAERREITEGLSRLDEDWPDANEVVRRLIKAQEAVVRSAPSVFPTVERQGDEATADLLTQRLQLHEKTAWMLRSMLEAP